MLPKQLEMTMPGSIIEPMSCGIIPIVSKYCGFPNKDFIFEINESEETEFEQRKLEYLSSEFHRFDSYIMSLKKISEYTPR